MKEIVDQLSQREKYLLYFLVCFLVVIAGWFLLITPALDKQSMLNAEYETIITENMNKKTELSNYMNAPDQLKIKKDSFNQLIKKYNPILSNEKIDKLLTTLFLSKGLTPKSLTIASITPAKTSADTADASKKTETNETSFVYQVTVNVTVSGSLNQIMNTIDAINEKKGMEVSSLSYTESSDLKKATSTALTIVVYMAAQ